MTCNILHFVANRTRSTESILMEDLFQHYDRDARPIKNVSEPVRIGIDIYMNKILELVSNLFALRLFPVCAWVLIYHYISKEKYVTDSFGIKFILNYLQCIWKH